MFCNNFKLKNKTRIQAFKELKQVLKRAHIEDEEIKSKLLLSNAIGSDMSDIFIYGDTFLSKAQSSIIKKSLKRLFAGKPFQYAINSADFYGYKFYVDKRVLIPRFETEFLVKEAIFNLNAYKNDMLDICTGSGCIAISVKRTLPYVNITASDVSVKALKVARINAEKIVKGSYINFKKSDMFDNIDGKFDVITANPPYICEREYLSLDAYVADYEPKGALFGGKDGMSYYRIIARDAKEHMKDTGKLIIEVGYGQKDSIDKIFAADYTNVKWIKDFSNIDRIAVFQRKDLLNDR